MMRILLTLLMLIIYSIAAYRLYRFVREEYCVGPLNAIGSVVVVTLLYAVILLT